MTKLSMFTLLCISVLYLCSAEAPTDTDWARIFYLIESAKNSMGRSGHIGKHLSSVEDPMYEDMFLPKAIKLEGDKYPPGNDTKYFVNEQCIVCVKASQCERQMFGMFTGTGSTHTKMRHEALKLFKKLAKKITNKNKVLWVEVQEEEWATPALYKENGKFSRTGKKLRQECVGDYKEDKGKDTCVSWMDEDDAAQTKFFKSRSLAKKYYNKQKDDDVEEMFLLGYTSQNMKPETKAPDIGKKCNFWVNEITEEDYVDE